MVLGSALAWGWQAVVIVTFAIFTSYFGNQFSVLDVSLQDHCVCYSKINVIPAALLYKHFGNIQ